MASCNKNDMHACMLFCIAKEITGSHFTYLYFIYYSQIHTHNYFSSCTTFLMIFNDRFNLNNMFEYRYFIFRSQY